MRALRLLLLFQVTLAGACQSNDHRATAESGLPAKPSTSPEAMTPSPTSTYVTSQKALKPSSPSFFSFLWASSCDKHRQAIAEWFSAGAALPPAASAPVAGTDVWSLPSPPQCESRRHVKHTATSDDIVVFDPNAVALWPGAVVKTTSVPSGTLALINVDRAPLDINILNTPPGIALDESARHAHIRLPDAGSVGAAVVRALTSNVIFPSVTAQSSLSVAESSEEKRLDLAISGNYLAASVTARLKSAESAGRATAVVSFTQRFYTVGAQPPMSPQDVFGCNVTVNDLTSRGGNPQDFAWIESVSYGKRIMVILSADRTASNWEAALHAAASGLAASFSMDANAGARYEAQGFTSDVLVFGGSPDDAVLFSGSSFTDKLKNLATALGRKPTADDVRTALPISYQVTRLSDQTKMAMNLATEFDEVRTLPFVKGGYENNTVWPPKIRVSQVTYHTGHNGRKDNTDYWTTVTFRQGNRQVATCRSQNGPREDTDNHIDESVGMEENCEHPWGPGEIMNVAPCIRAGTEDAWDVELVVPVDNVRPFHFDFTGGNHPDSDGQTVCRLQGVPLGDPPQAPRLLPDRCGDNGSAPRIDGTPKPGDTFGPTNTLR